MSSIILGRLGWWVCSFLRPAPVLRMRWSFVFVPCWSSFLPLVMVFGEQLLILAIFYCFRSRIRLPGLPKIIVFVFRLVLAALF
jgi:hypothetical protein